MNYTNLKANNYKWRTQQKQTKIIKNDKEIQELYIYRLKTKVFIPNQKVYC